MRGIEGIETYNYMSAAFFVGMREQSNIQLFSIFSVFITAARQILKAGAVFLRMAFCPFKFPFILIIGAQGIFFQKNLGEILLQSGMNYVDGRKFLAFIMYKVNCWAVGPCLN